MRTVAEVGVTDVWSTLLQYGGAVSVLALMLYLILQRGTLRSDREVKDRDAQIAKLEARHVQEMTDMKAAYETRIAKLEALVARNETMIFELSGAARALAGASRRKGAAGADDGAG